MGMSGSEHDNGTEDTGSEWLESGLRALREQPSATPATLPDRVMNEVRRQQRQGRLIPLTDGGTVTEVDVASVLREAADAVGGVTARGCRVRPTRDATGSPIPGPVEVTLAVTMSYGSIIPTLAATVETALRATLTERYGLAIAPFTLRVEDLSGTDDKTGVHDGPVGGSAPDRERAPLL